MFIRLAITAASTLLGYGISVWWNKQPEKLEHELLELSCSHISARKRSLPPRTEQLHALQSGQLFDVLVIGGGAVGAGCALDAVTRGLKTALVEANDFASGTSSKSTKLLRSGFMSLLQSRFQWNTDKYNLHMEALKERSTIMHICPYLCQTLPIMLPIYKWYDLPYYWLCIKCFDLLTWQHSLKKSYLLNSEGTLLAYPMLRKQRLWGAIVYHETLHDDARMCISIALTAARYGAVVANHLEVLELLKGNKELSEPVLQGVRVRDQLTGNEFEIKAKCIINAAGAYADNIRILDDLNAEPLCEHSSGTHVVLPRFYAPAEMALLLHSQQNKSVLFFLPWHEHVIAGATEVRSYKNPQIKPSEPEILYILRELKSFLNADVNVRRTDVLSAWSSLRCTVKADDVLQAPRRHLVHVSASKLITIVGGKWTTYRLMAEQTIDKAIEVCQLKPETAKSISSQLQLAGAENWSPTMHIRLVQLFGLEYDVAQHLSKAYGDRAFDVATLAKPTGKSWPLIGTRLHNDLPYIEAEVRNGIYEYACTAIDMIARRLRLAFLDVRIADSVLPRIVDIMAEELHWNEQQKALQLKEARRFLAYDMGEIHSIMTKYRPFELSHEDRSTFTNRFHLIDKERKGWINIKDVYRDLELDASVNIKEIELNSLLEQIDMTNQGKLALEDYLQLIAVLKHKTLMNMHSE